MASIESTAERVFAGHRIVSLHDDLRRALQPVDIIDRRAQVLEHLIGEPVREFSVPLRVERLNHSLGGFGERLFWPVTPPVAEQAAEGFELDEEAVYQVA